VKFGSVCSGIEAASVAWESLGWQASWLAEIEPFPSAVLKHHWPEVTNIGDMTLLPSMIRNNQAAAPDVFVGGTPCQSFSIAGLRKGLSDDRGNLTLTFVEIANAIDDIRRNNGKRESIIVWENVPGVLSSKDNAFGCFLAGLCGEGNPLQPTGARWSNAGCVYGPERAVAWRVLDAQFFGVAQRRRRVFVVASARAGFNPAEVLFEFDGLRRDSAPSREKRKDAAASTGSSAKIASGKETIGTLMACAGEKQWLGNQEALTGNYHILQPITLAGNTIGRQAHNGGNGNGFDESGICYTLTTADVHGVFNRADSHGAYCSDDIASTCLSRDYKSASDLVVSNQKPVCELAPTMGASGAGFSRTTGSKGLEVESLIQHKTQVRRLTPTECERLQGFPDGHTLIPWRGRLASDCPDSPRYKALGNSMAVPVMRWIGKRIDEALKQ